MLRFHAITYLPTYIPTYVLQNRHDVQGVMKVGCDARSVLGLYL